MSLEQKGSSSPWWAALVFGLLAAATVRSGSRSARQTADGPRSAALGRSRDRPDQRAKSSDASGRNARQPSELPARSWKNILWRVYEEIGNDRVLAVAAGVTFYGLLAVFPAILALVSLYGLFADVGTISEHLDSLKGVLPGGAIDIVGEQVKRIASKPHSSLGFGFIAGLLVALWSANAGMKAMFDALNVCYGEKERRNFFVLNASSLLFTLAAIVALLLILGAVVVLPVVLNFLHLGKSLELVLSLLRWPILLVLVGLGLAVLYRFGPSRKRPRWRWVSWGSAFAAITWLIGSAAFSFYVGHFGSYNETYGSLGAAIGFMTWIWISTTIVLTGAEINSEMEHETARDTTEGPEKPLGARGATMADHVAG